MPAESYNELLGLGTHAKLAELQLLLDESTATTTVVDQSGNGYNGTMNNMAGDTNTVAGPTTFRNKALLFNGSDEDIDIGQAPLLNFEGTDSFTMLAWMQRDSDAETGFIISNITSTEGYGLNVRPNAIALTRVTSPANGAVSSEVFTGAAWQHVGIVHSDSDVSFYRNGALTGTAEMALALTSSSFSEVVVGNRLDGASAGNFFDGAIAEILIFASALSADEIAQVYAGPEPLNTGAPTLAIDSSGNWTGTVGTWNSQNNGTLTYAWELRDDSDDSVVDSGSGSSPSGTVISSGSYYLHVRASNSGGFDSAEDSDSEVEEYTAPAGGGAVSNYYPSGSPQGIVGIHGIRGI